MRKKKHTHWIVKDIKGKFTFVQEEGVRRVKPCLESVYLWSSISCWANNIALGKKVHRNGERRKVRLSFLLVKQGVCLWGDVDLKIEGKGWELELEETWMSLWKTVVCERVDKLFKAILES